MKESFPNNIVDQFFENSIDLLCVADTEGFFKKLNTEWERTLGYSLSELTGRRFIDFVHPDDVEKTIRATEKLANNEKIENFINRYRHKNGTYRWIEWRSFPAEGMIFASAHDITDHINIQQALRESEERSKLIASLTTDYAFKFKVDETQKLSLVYITENLQEITGRTIDEAGNMENWKNIVHPDDYVNVKDYIRRLIETGKEEEIECRSIVRDKIRWVTIVAKPEIDSFTGRVLAITGAVKDITLRKKAEEELRQKEEKFRSIVENALAGIFTVDNAYRFIYVNKELCKLLGYSQDELVGMDFRKVLTPDSLETVVNRYIKRQRGEKVLPRYEIGIIRRDGHVRRVDMLVNVIKDSAGYPLSMGQLIDITESKIAEEALRESEQKYRDVFNATSDAILIYEMPDGNLIDANDAMLRIYGYNSKEQAIREGINAFTTGTYPYTLENALDKLRLAEKTGSQTFEWQIIHRKTHKPVWIEVSLTKSLISNKSRIIASVRDITERRNTELALKESETILKATMESMSDGVLVVTDKGKTTHFNTHFSQLFSIPDNILATRHDETLLNYAKSKLADPEGFYKKVMEIYNTNKSTEDTIHFADGRIIERLSYPLPKDSPIKGRVWLFRDITERKKEEDALLKNQTWLRESQRIANIGSWEYYYANNKLIWNEEAYKIYGFAYQQIQPRIEDFIELVHPGDRQIIRTHLKESFQTKGFNDFECRIVRPDGTQRAILVVGAITLDENNESYRSFGIVQDITERKKSEEEIKNLNTELEARVLERTAQLEKANKDLESFAYSVSHDLRAPLRHIDGFVRMMYTNISNPSETTKGYMEKINYASKRMACMIDELLAFSRLGRRELTMKSINLNTLVMEIIEQFKPDYTTRNIEWTIENIPAIHGDKALLKIAFENLISNAIKYTSKKTKAKIKIGTSRVTKQQVTVYIKDNGTGFNMDYVHKLFGVFQRLHNSEEYEGTGIGLANVKQIITKHGGSVSAKSKVNYGATFYITLPK